MERAVAQAGLAQAAELPGAAPPHNGMTQRPEAPSMNPTRQECGVGPATGHRTTRGGGRTRGDP